MNVDAATAIACALLQSQQGTALGCSRVEDLLNVGFLLMGVTRRLSKRLFSIVISSKA